MKTLEQAPRPSTALPAKTTWGLMHRLRLLGIVLVLAAIGGGGWLYKNKPVSPFDAVNPDQIRQDYQSFTPSVTWDGWNYMQKGLDRRTDQVYAAAVLRFRAWQIVVGVVAIGGIALFIAGAMGIRH